MAQEFAAARIKRSMKHKKLSATDHIYSPGDYVLVWREKIVNNRIGQLISLCTVLTFEPASKIVILDQNGTIETIYCSPDKNLFPGTGCYTRFHN